jgi:hypothetical protein
MNAGDFDDLIDVLRTATREIAPYPSCRRLGDGRIGDQKTLIGGGLIAVAGFVVLLTNSSWRAV